MTRVGAIVLAAGSGERFGDRKQFSELRTGFTLIDAALETMFRFTDSLVLVLPRGVEWDDPAVKAVAGGSSRIESAAHGLRALTDDPDVVLIHDAAHPLADIDTISALLVAIEGGADAAVPVLLVSDVVKRVDSGGAITTVGRENLGLAQVPMAFETSALRAAYRRFATLGGAWEDSLLVEKAGGRVVAVPGSPYNVHVVTQDDLRIARTLAHAKEGPE